MNYIYYILLSCLVLMALMLLSYATGFYFKKFHAPKDMDSEGSKTISAAVFAILGLLIAFSFSKSYSRLDERKQLIVKEVNAISTANLRLDLLSLDEKQPLRLAFKKYITARADFYKTLDTPERNQDELKKTIMLQNTIWAEIVAATQGEHKTAMELLLIPAVNDMFDIVITRTQISHSHPPIFIYLLIAVVAILCSGLAGYSSGASERSAINIYNIVFALIASFTFYIILDIEYPALGLVSLESTNALFEQANINQ